MSVICEGCGQRVPIPEGYRRNKIQCVCGVICVVPETARPPTEEPTDKPSAATAKPARAIEAEAERWLLNDDRPAPPASSPPRFRAPEPTPQPAPAAKRSSAKMRFPCRRCGQLVRRQGECPDCDGAAATTDAKDDPVWWPSVDEPADHNDDDEAPATYTVEGADEVKCPKCGFMLPPGSVLCVRCGFHLRKRKKIVKTYQPIERVWETTASSRSRLRLFIVCSTVFLISGLIGVLNGGIGLSVYLFFSLLVTAMAAFLLGTFDRIHLLRDSRGRVQLTKTWRLCFVARSPQTIDVRSYEGIVSGRHHDVTAWEWCIFSFLFCTGIVPGIIWWYMVIYKVGYHVALSREHGFPEYVLYSGQSETQMKEIAYTLRDASALPYDEG